MHVKKGDRVKILAGKDKGKTGKIIRALPAEGRVVVDGVNIVKKHQKPKKRDQKGQIVDMAVPIDASNVKKISETGAKKKSSKAKK